MGGRAGVGHASATSTRAPLRAHVHECQWKSLFKMSSHSSSISLYSTVCIVDVLCWEGKSFCLLWTWNGLHYYGDCLERYLFREDCYVFARVARMFSMPFFDIFENCFVKFLQINKFLFRDLVQLQDSLWHSSSENLILLSNSAIWL